MKNTNKNKKNRHGYTKEEIKENREELIKDPFKALIEPTIRYWKENTGKALITFFGWVIIVYIIGTFAQALNYDMMYCDSSLDEYDGKVLRVYNPFIEHMNREIEEFNKAYNPYELVDMPLPMELNQSIRCEYDLKRWAKSDRDWETLLFLCSCVL